MSEPEAPVAVAAEAPPAPAKKKSRAKLFVIVGVVVALLGGGGAAAYFTLAGGGAHGEAEAGEHEDAEHEDTSHHRIIPFEPFVVNLADQDARRFLRISVRLVVADEEGGGHGAKDSEVTLERLRSEILEQLTHQTSAGVATQEGKEALKKAISERAAKILKPMEVADVLFSDFVVQY
jgi:flagellar FliL protein